MSNLLEQPAIQQRGILWKDTRGQGSHGGAAILGDVMRFQRLVLFSLLLVCLPVSVRAQSWSGVLDPSRAIDWSTIGAGPIPSGGWTQCGPTIAPYSGTADSINNAIATCGPNQYVHLGAGTFNLSSSL